MKEKTIRRAKNALRIVSGGLIGTLDVMTTGFPLATLGIPAVERVKMLDDYAKELKARGKEFVLVADKETTLKECNRSYIPYLAGAAVPFCIKYSPQIYEILNNLNQ